MATTIDDIDAHDLLPEIFLRLPDSKFLFRSSSVSKRWHFLISDPAFRRRYAATFSPRHCFIFQDLHFTSCPQTLSRQSGEPPLCHAIVKAMSEVDAPIGVRASSGDLVLIFGRQFFVANVTTGDVLPLPPFPKSPMKYSRLAMLRDRHSGLLSRVVAVCLGILNGSRKTILVSVFSAESNMLEDKMVCAPEGLSRYFYNVRAVVAGGVMYWPNVRHRVPMPPALIALDCTTFSCSCIDFPSHFDSHNKLSIGVSREKLQISYTFKESGESGQFVIEVWELRTNGGSLTSSWSLVHKRRLRVTCQVLHVVGFHSEDSDILYLLIDNGAYRYNVSTNMVERYMGEFLGNQESIPHSNLVFPFASQAWPTPLHNENITRKPLQEYFSYDIDEYFNIKRKVHKLAP